MATTIRVLPQPGSIGAQRNQIAKKNQQIIQLREQVSQLRQQLNVLRAGVGVPAYAGASSAYLPQQVLSYPANYAPTYQQPAYPSLSDVGNFLGTALSGVASLGNSLRTPTTSTWQSPMQVGPFGGSMW